MLIKVKLCFIEIVFLLIRRQSQLGECVSQVFFLFSDEAGCIIITCFKYPFTRQGLHTLTTITQLSHRTREITGIFLKIMIIILQVTVW